MAALILLVPALYNYWEFDQKVIAAGALSGRTVFLYRAVNIGGFAIGFVAIWLFAIPLFEGIALLLRRLVARRVDVESWLAVLYRTLERSVLLAIAGAVLWGIWAYAFYQADVNFLALSLSVGIPAHLLAACLYLPLIWGWNRLWRSADAEISPQDEYGSS